jgi:hypothetical protein
MLRCEATAGHFDNAAWTLRPSRAHEPAKVATFLDFLHGELEDGAPWARRQGLPQ